jgi:hypothetical protein
MREVWPLLTVLAMLDEMMRGVGRSVVVEDAAFDQIVGGLDRLRDGSPKRS